MMAHGVRENCCLTNNAYFVYWRRHSARNETQRWRCFFDKNPNHFQVVAQPNSRKYNTSGGQAASVFASIWFCKDVGQDHFTKFATTTSQRCPTLENGVRETYLGFLQLKLQRQHILDTTSTSLSHWHGNILYCACGFQFFSARLSIFDLRGPLTPNFGTKF